MKSVNLKSLIEIYELNNGKFPQAYINFLGSKDYQLTVKQKELCPLISLLKILSGKPHSLHTNLFMPFYFEKFLNNILLVLKQTDKREELTKIYNLLCKAIENTVRFNYKGEIPEILKSLLQEYNKKTTDNVQNNVQNLAIKICQTPGLIQYANLYTNFYLEEI